MKLGKLPPKFHPKTLMLSKYLSSNLLPNPAERVFREYKTPDAAKQFFGNDEIGDCTCAGAANLLILATCHTGTVVIPTLAEVIAMYSTVSGYIPGDASTDNGAAMTDVLSYLQSTGLSGHKILAWAAIDYTNLNHRQLGVQLFGATYVGVNLPQSAQDQFAAGTSWEVVPDDPIEGGHAIIHPGYGSEGGDYVTWAKWDQKASSAWENKYIEEEYVLITEDWFELVRKKHHGKKHKKSQTPSGIDLATLEADLKALGV
jgi:hypothetical protein